MRPKRTEPTLRPLHPCGSNKGDNLMEVNSTGINLLHNAPLPVLGVECCLPLKIRAQ
ncbi:MAG: hypothetical protein H6558_23130 [Lewinellaceae bacterium]|nr:hypothetical protein [Lewinellaceae bacterium]